MTEPKRPLKVFLSYASQDKPLVRELSRRLTGEGWIDTWQDEKNLLPGQDWRVKIEEAVEEADVVIIVLSQHSVSKEGHVQKELRYAREIALEKPEDAIFLIPLRLDECEVPRGLRFYQWVDYFDDKKDVSYKALVASLKLRYEQKLKAEKEERLRKEQQEREAAEKVAREKRTLLEAEEFKRQKAETENKEHIPPAGLIKSLDSKDLNTINLNSNSVIRQSDFEKPPLVENKQDENELREKRTREAREKENHVSEKIGEKPVVVKPKSGGQITYWFGGFIFVAVIILFALSNNLLSNLNSLPESTQTNIFFTATNIKTVRPNITSVIPTETITLTPTFSVPYTYTVQDGDSLAVIADKFNLGEDAIPLILLLNPFNPDTGIGIDPTTQITIPGQVILLPNPDMKLPTATPISPNLPRGTLLEYTVQSGDSLIGIASKFNSTIEAIIQQNNIDNPNGLFVGQVLVIPVNLVTSTPNP